MTDLREAISAACEAGRVTRAHRIRIPLGSICPFEWLAAQTASRQSLWSCRNTTDIRAGLGCAGLITASGIRDAATIFEEARAVLSQFEASEARFVGGFAFQDGSTVDEPWPEFGPVQFWMPRFECVRNSAGSHLACNLLPGDREDDLLAEASYLRDVVPVAGLSSITSREDWPDLAGWEANVSAALEQIEAGRLEKIVLARKAVYAFATAESAARILAVLRAVTSNCFHFLLQPSEAAAFMGTPPECLFRREGRALQTEALAGTRPRVENPEDDAALARDLLNSDKEAREHGIVRDSLLRRLTPVSEHLTADQVPELLRLERKQHLISRISARLKEGVTDASLLQSLHPTPAVGGVPRERALEEIRALEPFARGWYASPVGWIARDACEFAVAIRSGLVSGKKVGVYSGAGIVAGSDPLQEWQEIENKISDFVKVTQGSPA